MLNSAINERSINLCNITCFYEASHILERLSGYYEKSHIKEADLHLLRLYIAQSGRILEVGPGFGRVLDFLLTVSAGSSSITAIEASELIYRQLSLRYGSQVNLQYGDVLTAPLSGNFDLALLLWGTIVDFSKSEQILLLRRLGGQLSSCGYLVVDLLKAPGVSQVATSCQGQELAIIESGAQQRGYLPSVSELVQQAKQVGLQLHELLSYGGDKGGRFLCIFKRSH